MHNKRGRGSEVAPLEGAVHGFISTSTVPEGPASGEQADKSYGPHERAKAAKSVRKRPENKPSNPRLQMRRRKTR